MRYIFNVILLTCLFYNTAKSQHVLRIYLDQNMPVTTVINDSKIFNAELKVKKYLKAKTLMIKMETKTETPFNHLLQLTNEQDSVLLTLPENKTHENTFSFDVKKVKQLVLKYPHQKLYLLEEPKNNMMKIRSKSVLLMNLHFK